MALLKFDDWLTPMSNWQSYERVDTLPVEK
jgi:hypothetical protein